MFKFIIVLFFSLFHFRFVVADCIKEIVSLRGSQDCVYQLEDAIPYYQQLGDNHLDNGTGRYTVIDRSHSTTINISRFEDGGIYCFYCNGSTLYCIGSSSYCYFIIAVYPDLNSVVLNVSEAVVGQSVNITCAATGFPAPKVEMRLCQSPELPNSTFIVNNTRRVSISTELPSNCSTVSCLSYPIMCTERVSYINIEATTTTTSTTTTTTVAIDSTTAIVTSSSSTITVSVVPTSTSNGAITEAVHTTVIMLLIILSTVIT